MDAVAISELWRLAPVVTVLLIAILWFAWRDKRSDERAVRREDDCKEMNKALGLRIELLEQRQFDRLEDVAERSIAEIAASTAARRRAMGDHVTPPNPLPTLNIHHPSDAHR